MAVIQVLEPWPECLPPGFPFVTLGQLDRTPTLALPYRILLALALVPACSAPRSLGPLTGERIDCSMEALCQSLTEADDAPYRPSRRELLDDFDGPLLGWIAEDSPTVAGVLADMRARLSVLSKESDRSVLFETLPQGLRSWSGVPRRADDEYLRNGVLRVHTFVSDALDQDHALEELQRNAAILASLLPQHPTRRQSHLTPIATVCNRSDADWSEKGAAETRLACHPSGLYDQLTCLGAVEVGNAGVTLVSVAIPYTPSSPKGHARVRSYSVYFGPRGGVMGFDVLDTQEAAHYRDHRYTTPLGKVGNWITFPLTWVYDLAFQNPVWGKKYPLLAPVNFGASAVVQVGTAVKECAFEILKSPFSALASLVSSDASATRFIKSFEEPWRSVPEIIEFHGEQLVENGALEGPLRSLDLALQQVPLIGAYMPNYFDDPWVEFSEAPPGPNHSVARESAQVDYQASHPTYVFLSRGIHGRGGHEQGNDTWQAWMSELADHASGGIKSLGSSAQEFEVRDAPYAWGTVLDPVFSLLNLSHGYAYTLADQVVDAVEDRREDPPIVSFIAHSGGVQRCTVASRLLWNRDVFTESIYGVAGPTVAYAPTKPDQNRQVLSKSEFRDEDFTSQVSSTVATLEDAILLLFELPVIGPMWWLSIKSRGYATSYQNVDTLRIEGRESTSHRNPGTVDAERRDLMLTFFRRDLAVFLAEKALLRQAYLQTNADRHR